MKKFDRIVEAVTTINEKTYEIEGKKFKFDPEYLYDVYLSGRKDDEALQKTFKVSAEDFNMIIAYYENEELYKS